MRTGRQDKSAGALDRIAGRVMEAFSKLTGRQGAGAKGKAARGRGTARTARGRAKSAGRR